MKKNKFMLTRKFNKTSTFSGIRTVARGGNLLPIKQIVEVSFSPGKIAEVDADIDMSAVVESGFVIPVVMNEREDEVVSEEIVAEEIVADVEATVVEAVEIEGDSGVEKGEVDSGDADSDEGEEPEEGSKSDESDDKSYVQDEDGTFSCLICEKKYKRETSMVKHVSEKHGE